VTSSCLGSSGGVSEDYLRSFSGTTLLLKLQVKVKVSRDRPRWPKGFRYVKALDFLDFRHYEGGNVVTLTHRPSLLPGVSWYSFFEAESTPGHMVPLVATEKIPSDSNGDGSRDPPTSSGVP
jgi:hypothetical protein